MTSSAITLDLSLLGTFAVRAAERSIRIPTRKGCAVLGYLALSKPHECSRETLLGLLWSDVEENKARSSLRQALHEIQGPLARVGYTGFVADRLTLKLASDSITSDIEEILRLAKEGRAHPRLFDGQRIIDDLLRDIENVDPAFRDWLAAKRQSIQERLLADLSNALRHSAVGPNQLELARAILNQDATHEEAARSAIRAHARGGDVGGALRIYRQLWTTLESEFDVEPTKETQELVAAIKLGKSIDATVLDTPRTVVVAQPAKQASPGGPSPSREQLERSLQTLVQSHGGRFSLREDNTYVLDFSDPRKAVKAALDLGNPAAPTRRAGLRLGAHAAVPAGGGSETRRVARQLSNRAAPGELLVSGQVRDMITDGLDATIEDTGAREGKALRTFRVSAPTHPTEATVESIQPSIAFIPFELVGKSAKEPLVGDVLAEELISAFSAFKELTVISRLSTRIFKGRTSTLQDYRERLNATYVLSGSYDLRDQNLRLHAEFADARSGTVLWGREFKANVGSILSGSSDVVNEMTAAVSASVLTRELDRVRSRPLETLENYSLLMAAIGLSHRTSPASFAQARALLQLLVDRLPAHPLPLAWLAKWHVFRINLGLSTDREADSRSALDFATQAIDADPSCSVALTVDAWASLNLRRRFDLARQRFEQAVEVNPSDSIAWLLKGTMHAFKGEGAAAVDAARRAIRLSPLDPRRSYYDSLAATAHLSAGSYATAIELAQRSLRVDKLHLSTLRALAISQWLSGQHDEARGTVKTLMDMAPALTVSRYLAGHPAADYPVGKLWAETLGRAGLPK